MAVELHHVIVTDQQLNEITTSRLRRIQNVLLDNEATRKTTGQQYSNGTGMHRNAFRFFQDDPNHGETSPSIRFSWRGLCQIKHFHTKNAPNVVWRPGSARTRWWSLQRSPRPNGCIETPRAFGARSYASTAPRLTSSAFALADTTVRFFFFPIRTLQDKMCWKPQ